MTVGEATEGDGRTLSWSGTAYRLSSEDESSELIVGREDCVALTLPTSEGGGNVMEGDGKVMEGSWNSLAMSSWFIFGTGVEVDSVIEDAVCETVCNIIEG